MNRQRIDLPYRPPLAWRELTAFLAPRATPGIEEITPELYSRNALVGDRLVRLEARPRAGSDSLLLEVVEPSGCPLEAAQLSDLTGRARRLFDLDCDPAAIATVLGADPTLAPLVAARPGLRVPGAWSGFETAVRAILGQQVTVRGATTLCGRLVDSYGPSKSGARLFPEPRTLARARFPRVGLTGARAATIRALASACASGELCLDTGADPVATVAGLKRIRGIGDWTAQYIAMRVLRLADAFPSGDLGLLRAANVLIRPRPGSSPLLPGDLRRLAEPWRPFRAYAALHLWHSLG